MLESLTLHNWQAHVKRTISFDRVTTIIGSTDAGKSAIIRALRWVVLNQFDGPADSFIHWDEDFARVKLRVDGHLIVRRKGNENIYRLDGHEYKSFGLNKVPEPIADVLQLTEVNFQAQFDTHFWLSDSAGQVSRELNQVVNLSVIDDSLAKVAALGREHSSVVTVIEQQVVTSRERLQGMRWVKVADQALSSIEVLDKRLQAYKRRIEGLRGLVTAWAETSNAQAKARQTVDMGVRVRDLGARTLDIGGRVSRLRDLLVSLGKVHKIVTTPVPICSVSPDKVKALSSRRGALEKLIRQHNETEDKLCQHNEHLEAVKQQLAKVVKCPLCEQPLMSSHCSSQTST